MFTNLDQETRWQFQVYGLNDATAPGIPSATPDILKGVAEKSETEDAKTAEAVVPPAPMNLTAELARDTNFTGVGSRGVLVLWNAPADPAGAPVLGYKIERSIDGGEFEERVSSRDAGMTHWVDTNEPAMDEVRVYRVTSINAVGVGTMMASITIPLGMHTTHPPSAFTAPSGAMARAGSVAGTVDLSWTAGANATRHWILAIRADGALGGYAWVQASGDSSHTLTALDSGVAYIFGVNAGNAANEWAGWTFTTGTPD